MAFDYDEARDLFEDRWQAHGFDNLLQEERDYILLWWLEKETQNGSLHQYFCNATGDGALDALSAMDRIGVPKTRAIFQAAIDAFQPAGGYSTDRATRQQRLAQLPNQFDAFRKLTDSLFGTEEEVVATAFDRVISAYELQGISGDSDVAVRGLRKPWWRWW